MIAGKLRFGYEEDWKEEVTTKKLKFGIQPSSSTLVNRIGYYKVKKPVVLESASPLIDVNGNIVARMRAFYDLVDRCGPMQVSRG